MPAGYHWPVPVAAAVAFAFSAGILPFLRGTLIDRGITAVNYRGSSIPTGGGLIIPLGYLAAWMAAGMLQPGGAGGGPGAGPGPAGSFGAAGATGPAGAALSLLFITNAFALWGLLDDSPSGSSSGAPGREPRGWRGHMKEILRGRFTTGAFKIIGMGGAGGAGALLAGAPGYWIIPGAVLIAMAANVLNLFDLRPGRAVKVFWLGIFSLALAFPEYGGWGAVVPLLAVILAWGPWDFSGRMMLGDTGANILGGCLGIVFVGIAVERGLTILFPGIALLAVLQVSAELASWTKIIASVPVLNYLDGLGRVPPPSGGEGGMGAGTVSSVREYRERDSR